MLFMLLLLPMGINKDQFLNWIELNWLRYDWVRRRKLLCVVTVLQGTVLRCSFKLLFKAPGVQWSSVASRITEYIARLWGWHNLYDLIPSIALAAYKRGDLVSHIRFPAAILQRVVFFFFSVLPALLLVQPVYNTDFKCGCATKTWWVCGANDGYCLHLNKNLCVEDTYLQQYLRSAPQVYNSNLIIFGREP